MSDNLPVPKDPATVAIEKGIDKAFETATHYLDKLVAGPLEEGGGIVKDTIAYWRFKRQIGLVLKAKEFLESKGIDPQRVLPKIVIPILEAGSLEVDDEMSDRWAALLANAAAAPETISPAFPRILAELSPLDARILQYAYEHVVKTGRHPTHIHWKDAIQAAGVVFPPNYPKAETGVLVSDDPVLGSTIHNLIRLELVTGSLTEYYALNHEIINKEIFNLTPFGFIFVRACNPPN